MGACRCWLLAAAACRFDVALVVTTLEESDGGSACDLLVEVGGPGDEAISIQFGVGGS